MNDPYGGNAGLKRQNPAFASWMPQKSKIRLRMCLIVAKINARNKAFVCKRQAKFGEGIGAGYSVRHRFNKLLTALSPCDIMKPAK